MDTGADDKAKRFRLHVVKEIYETELDYTSALEFTVEHIQAKLHLKAANDKSITEDVLIKLFSNIDQLLHTHKLLIADLNSTIGLSPSADSPIAGCYLKHIDGFKQYKIYGENNEHAQKILYELENDQSFKAFFMGLMLLGGKTDVSISSYLFKPIQRICKYPLLFRELMKYTPLDHCDYNATVHALSMMKDMCSVINEAKRRMECLEAIADWQCSVDGWEGSSVVDTCSELIKEGQLVKISAGNIQERMFFLFDNLLVYCKRNSTFPIRSKTDQKALYFRGRIPVANIEIENIEDGTCDYQTSRVQVNFGWKVRNLAKNKWFVLIAKSPGEKQQWMDAIRAQKDRIERAKVGFAREMRTLMLDKGEKLHRRLVNEGRVLDDHRYRFRVYSKSFTGSDLAKWFIETGEATNDNEAVRLGQALLENGVIHHVADRHQFKSSQLIYRFRVDDGTLHLTNQTLDTLAKGIRVYASLHSLFHAAIRDHRSGLRTVKSSISGSALVDLLIEEKYFQTRKECVDFGTHLMAIGVLKHSTDDQKFKDNNSLYYQFTADMFGNEQLPIHSADFVPIATYSCLVLTIPYDSSTKSYGFEIEDYHISSVVNGSVAEELGISTGQEIIGIGGQYLNSASSPYMQCLTMIDSHKEMEVPLEIIVKRNKMENVKIKLISEQLGFQLKGSHPVVVSKVEKGLQIARLGITPGCCIYSVNDEDVSKSSHEHVVTSIKSSQDRKEESINVEFGIFGTQQLNHYQFESSDDIMMEMSELVLESPYTFSVPAKLFKLYDAEARNRAKIISQRSRELSAAIVDYTMELQVQADNYRKAANALSNPRYPSFRPFGPPSSLVIECCPINLHTIMMEVGQSMRSASSPTPSLDPDGSLASGNADGSCKTAIDYSISSMGMPCLVNRSHSNGQVETLKKCQNIRFLLANLDSLYIEMSQDLELLKKLCKQDPAGSNSPSVTTLPRKFKTDSYSHIPSSPIPSSPIITGGYSLGSPLPGSRNRPRNVSFINPSPLVKIVLDGISSKIAQLEKFLTDSSLNEMLCNGAQQMTGNTVSDGTFSTSEWQKILECLKKDLVILPDDPKAILLFADNCIRSIKKIKNDVVFYLEVALAIYDNVEATDTWDRLFCQCLTSVVTAFASLLLIAARGHLNHASEYFKNPANASQQWLDLIAARGVLVCFRTLLLPNVPSELASMKDMMILVDRLKSVHFHIREQTDLPSSNSSLPNVSLTGNHNHLNVFFELPSNLLEFIPESLLSGEPVVLCPVMFNVTFQNTNQPCKTEQEINSESLTTLKDYYRGLRQYHLNKAVLPEQTEEKTVALQEVARPLSVIDELVQTLEKNIQNCENSGFQINVILSELTQRLGSVSLLVCDSGVYRCHSCSSLEQIVLLSRCHGLQSRHFRSSLNTLRKTGALPYIEMKNGTDRSKFVHIKCPRIYQITDTK